MVKAKIRVLHCLKIKFQRRKETQKRNFETCYKRYEVSKKRADTADQAHPRIYPSASSYIENFCHAVILLINKDVRADHSGNSISNTTRSMRE